MPSDPDDFIADMQGLAEAIQQFLQAVDCETPNDIAAAQADVLATLESCAVIHTDIVSTVLKQQRSATRRMGLRELTIPANFSGDWLVVPPAARPAL